MNHSGPRISVCLCTFHRPELLKQLLVALNAQTCPYDFEIVVVDNDKSGSAREIVLAFAQDVQRQVSYLIEPEQNISLARNKAVSAAVGELIAFIDDDEHPPPDWLALLIECMLKYDADAVLGPVVALLPEGTPPWVAESKLFDPPDHPTGASLPLAQAGTGNVLIKKTNLDRLEGPFDPRYGLSGGGDYEMFTRYHKIAPRIIWCREASVTEHVPPQRTKLGWILKRGLRCGINGVQIDRGNKLELSAVIYCLGAATLGGFGFFFNRAKSVKNLRVAAYFLGRVLGAFSYRYFEYKK